MDERFAVSVLSQMLNPQQLIWAAAHQDYAEGFVAHERDSWPAESEAGEIVVRRLLSSDRGHYGPLEHPQIVFNVGWFPHSTMQQIRTHRLLSFDVQSGRYTGQRIIDVANGDRDLEEVFYLRPVGEYSDRQGKRYEYTEELRQFDLGWCQTSCFRYQDAVGMHGLSEEHARGLIPFDVRQHWVMSCNVRSLMHLFDLRWKADAQLECQQLCELIWPHFAAWVPEIAAWYEKTRAKKARLAP